MQFDYGITLVIDYNKVSGQYMIYTSVSVKPKDEIKKQTSTILNIVLDIKWLIVLQKKSIQVIIRFFGNSWVSGSKNLISPDELKKYTLGSARPVIVLIFEVILTQEMLRSILSVEARTYVSGFL